MSAEAASEQKAGAQRRAGEQGARNLHSDRPHARPMRGAGLCI
ncbi:hypothetical protein J2S92_001504 [Arthrobacter bambusae]|nr:hypothetical protein [Arthrobacter bambusae]MDQ0235505.1 hypothetical protein [Arthrobacter bambusae]